MKLAVIFGGTSTEHDVSVVSGTSVIKNLNKEKYDITPIYIDTDGTWYKYTKAINEIDILPIGEKIVEIEKIDNVMEILKKHDVIFPVLHGLYGEDGTVQGLFELLKIPYVGCGVLAASACMDKVYTKVILDKAEITQAKSEYVRKYNDEYIYIDKKFNEKICTLDEVCEIVEKNLKYPMFIKPSRSGSSVGVNKANTREKLKNAIEYASKYDKKILIEQGIFGHEVECAVLGNEEVIASSVGEIKSAPPPPANASIDPNGHADFICDCMKEDFDTFTLPPYGNSDRWFREARHLWISLRFNLFYYAHGANASLIRFLRPVGSKRPKVERPKSLRPWFQALT